ncbi:hypothetical protein LARI1_G008554 [Lachnellula arida]|uniref:Heterokaryon incompatibility domain-containing protein n=1 Tax=Lachnellula arida TaxID=1316785 RepID=A0A8T9BCJ4_9HELO|nr:hypothetical protein LARI1_G008554 [Lachnellula arida]
MRREEVLCTAMKKDNQQICIMPNSPNGRTHSALDGHSAFDELWVKLGEDDWTRVELFTTRGSPISKEFLGRDIKLDPSSQDSFDDINGWIEACSKHPNCQPPSDTSLPLRVVDVGSPGSNESQLATTRDQRGRYICLSYCWGLSPGVTTTYDSLTSHIMKGIPDAKLPATLRDAVYITRKLGFRYLWIDALCILQRRPELVNDQEAFADWQDQSSKMADIYGNAFLTIVASEASDKSEGCFIPRVPSPNICTLSLDETGSCEVFARIIVSPNYRLIPPIATRTWTFQEMALSQRSLIYGKEISYQCRSCTFREGKLMPGEVAPVTALFSPPVKSKSNYTYGNKNQGEWSTWKPTIIQESVRDHTLVTWYQSLEHNFCGRALTNDMDILPSLSGIAHRVQSIVGGDYYAGIWETDLPLGLLWKPRNFLPDGRGQWLTRPIEYRAPSWSWAALKGRIYYGITFRKHKNFENERKGFPCEILEVKTVLVGPAYDTMGQVSHAWIKMCAPMRRVVLVSGELNAFRNESTDYKGVTHRWQLKENENLLVDKEEINWSEPEAVGAIGSFDTKGPWSVDLWCVLVTFKEGLILESVRPGEAFRRVGIFKLKKTDWFNGHSSECLTVV